jgi:leader peptidase (prepilin peptidase) / N-methyltransferase
MGAGLAGVCVIAWLAVLSGYDIRERRLPNWLTMPGALAILTVATAVGRGVPASLGAVSLAVLYLVVHVMAPAAMGAGDVKLAVGLGGLTGAFGYDVWALAAIAAPLLTATVACVTVVCRRSDDDGGVPHGPSMCVASLVATALVIA